MRAAHIVLITALTCVSTPRPCDAFCGGGWPGEEHSHGPVYTSRVAKVVSVVAVDKVRVNDKGSNLVARIAGIAPVDSVREEVKKEYDYKNVSVSNMTRYLNYQPAILNHMRSRLPEGSKVWLSRDDDRKDKILAVSIDAIATNETYALSEFLAPALVSRGFALPAISEWNEGPSIAAGGFGGLSSFLASPRQLKKSKEEKRGIWADNTWGTSSFPSLEIPKGTDLSLTVPLRGTSFKARPSPGMALFGTPYAALTIICKDSDSVDSVIARASWINAKMTDYLNSKTAEEMTDPDATTELSEHMTRICAKKWPDRKAKPKISDVIVREMYVVPVARLE